MAKKNNNNTDELLYLDDIQVKRYLTIITDTSHKAVCKLLLNGISVNEILKIRARDVRYKSNQLALRKPKRRVKVDEATTIMLVEHIHRQKIPLLKKHSRSKDKIFKYNDRTIRDFVRRYGKIARLEIDVNPSVLLNTFYIIKLELKPDWSVEDYAKHLGINSLDWMKGRLDYFREEHRKLSANHKLFDHS